MERQQTPGDSKSKRQRAEFVRILLSQFTAFHPNGAQHISLGHVNPHMRMNAAQGFVNRYIRCPGLTCPGLSGRNTKSCHPVDDCHSVARKLIHPGEQFCSLRQRDAITDQQVRPQAAG